MIDRLNALLPQTQCGKCGFRGCLPYAEAMAAGLADINRCPPGGEDGIRALASLLNVESKPLDSACGTFGPRSVAFIVEDECIGCAKCLPACPVDAIVGTAKQLHTVIAAECTGCELCIAPCPVDCIELHIAPPESEHLGQSLKPIRAALAKTRFERRSGRIARIEEETATRAREKKAALLAKLKAAGNY